ncbi:Putative 2-amino-3-carboxymuconate-6-semialdehyde decarboxylase, metal-dependent hydrolase [Colletotrichum destructivum]|uniref:2-amino-3-carboxymuconate-6-semialdehyde decarboxylase, metal-dependent hydrolase n=1 Tax=Colletotrichum destructivum TaxID=34406 RepID=A0AAX4HWY1_9PEZI|nr:Putative 2-amino-3-carboxymuconate-6-semialdehyde decarboxylase, metal-dependent hydrolase [Colletotrichum destructivum]
MLGKIALEEAYEMTGQEAKSQREAALYINPSDRERYMRQISDINDERVRLSDAHGIGYTIVSLTVPGIQGIADPAEAERRATEVNDWAHAQIKDHRDRLGAFACLSMHDPAQAGRELTRCVRDLGFHGALLCDFQHAGDGGETYKFYDQPEYDAFWRVVCDLDVPVYIHPAAPADVVLDKLYAQRKYLIGPPLSFANGVSLHLMGLISNGVFDRFPGLKVIVGHLGEKLPFDFWRINHWFEDVKKPIARAEGGSNGSGGMCEKTIYDYFRRNIWVTTSGHFSTPTLRYVVDEIGADRVLFSVDYPYETIEACSAWWDGRAEEVKEAVGGVDNYRKIGRDNARDLLKLGKFHDSEAPVS